MKFLYFALFNEPNFPGGLENTVRKLLINLSPRYKNNTKILVFNPALEKEGKILEANYINLYRPRSLVPYLPNNLIKLLLIDKLVYSWLLAKYIKSYCSDCIINFHGVEISFFSLLTIRAKERRITFVTTYQGSLTEERLTFIKDLPFTQSLVKVAMIASLPLVYVIDVVGYKKSTFCVFITKHIASYIRNLALNTRGCPYAVIPNGYELSVCEKLSKLNGSKTKPCINVGSKAFHKGLDIALKALRQYNNSRCGRLKLKVVGYKDDVQNVNFLIKKYGNAVYLGVLENAQVLEEMRSSWFFILPSHYEGLPLSILESIASGTPYLCSEPCHAEEVDPEGKYGKVVKGFRIQDWVNGIKYLMDNYDYYKTNLADVVVLGEHAKNFSWSNITKRYEREVFDLFEN